MTLYFIDTEFNEHSWGIEPISIGIVCEDGREFYRQSTDFDLCHVGYNKQISPWIADHVIPQLSTCGLDWPFDTIMDSHRKFGPCSDPSCVWRNKAQIAFELADFMDATIYGQPEFISWIGAYDFVILCNLFGGFTHFPAQFPHYIKDLQEILDMQGIKDDELPPQKEGVHHALSDARYVKELWEKYA